MNERIYETPIRVWGASITLEIAAELAGSVEETGRNLVRGATNAPEYLGRTAINVLREADLIAGELYDSVKEQYTGRELWHLVKTGIIASCIYIGLG